MSAPAVAAPTVAELAFEPIIVTKPTITMRVIRDCVLQVERRPLSLTEDRVEFRVHGPNSARFLFVVKGRILKLTQPEGTWYSTTLPTRTAFYVTYEM